MRTTPRLFEATPRLRQLHALASEGDVDAKGDLFREFGFQYGIDYVFETQTAQKGKPRKEARHGRTNPE